MMARGGKLLRLAHVVDSELTPRAGPRPKPSDADMADSEMVGVTAGKLGRPGQGRGVCGQAGIKLES
jgi:hypothetical protein